MRWTDLPADPRLPEAGASGLRRGEWQALRQRLERLPAGHPSSGDDGAADDDAADEDALGEARDNEPWADTTAPPAPDGARERQADQPRGRPGGADGRSGREPDRSRRTGHAGGQDRAPLPAVSGREPYRPWFTSGESPDPWFADGSVPP